MKLKTKYNEYYYDNQTGIIMTGAQQLSAILNIENWDKKSKNEIVNLLQNKFDEKDISFYYDWIKKYIMFQNTFLQKDSEIEVNIPTIKNNLLHNGFKQLILSITNNCNFRCTYCVYSEEYSDSRNHSSESMEFKTAKKAIDWYFKYIEYGKKYNIFRIPVIGFYGGEPLLNFKLIKKIINYVNTTYSSYETSYTITTNGSLLTKTISDYLIKHNVSIVVSLDGDKFEQNRKRKYENNDETFEDVFTNISYILKKKYDAIYIASVYDWKTNLKNCNNFFKNNNLKVSIVSSVNNITTKDYYNRFDETDFKKFNENFSKLEQEYISTPNNEQDYLTEVIEYPLVSLLLDSNMLNIKRHIYPVTGCCIPGDKIFVNPDGEFHICERIPEIKSIGNVNTGLNFNNIEKIINEYNKILKECDKCEFSFICDKCFNNFMIDGEFKNTKIICKNEKEEMTDILNRALMLLEKNQNVVEKNYIKYYKLYNWRA